MTTKRDLERRVAGQQLPRGQYAHTNTFKIVVAAETKNKNRVNDKQKNKK